MQWAEGGSLDDLIDLRQGKAVKHVHFHPVSSPADVFSPIQDPASEEPVEEFDVSRMSRAARIKAFRAFQRAAPDERERIKARMGMGDKRRREAAWKAIHLLSAEEVKSLFGDVVEGLAFAREEGTRGQADTKTKRPVGCTPSCRRNSRGSNCILA